jgi:aldehyde dehydrogenase (NAD+)
MTAETLPGSYVGGRWLRSTAAVGIAVLNPTDESRLAMIEGGGGAEVAQAVAAAREAQPGWAALAPSERADALDRIATILERRGDEIAASIARDVGMPLKLSRNIQVALPIQSLRNTAQIVRGYAFERELGNSTIAMLPFGVVAAITPWNYPLHQMVAKVAPALASGNAVVVKPSEVAPLAALALADAVHEAGLPAGVFNLVVGYGTEAGEALVGHPDVAMVSFTGSTRTGKAIARLAAEAVKRVALELGGKSAALVTEEADLELAVKATVASCFLNSGQTCSAMTRLIVPARDSDRAAGLAAAAAAKFTMGDPLDPATRLGPLVSAPQRDRAAGFVTRAERDGARLVSGGAGMPAGRDRGYFFQPTVFTAVAPGSELEQEEVFAPVLAIVGYETEEDGIRIANGTRYGLAGSVWCADPVRAKKLARRIRAGQVDVNGGRYNPLAPFGGFGESGYGREMGAFGVEEFLQPSAIQT